MLHYTAAEDSNGIAALHTGLSGCESTTTRSWNRTTTSLDACRPLQGRGTARLRLWTQVDHYKVVEPLDYVSGRGSTTTRSWNRRTTSLDAGRPLQGCGTARLRLWTQVDHYKVVEPLDYVSGRRSTTTRSWNRTTSSLDAGRPLQGRGTARLRLWTQVDHYKVVEPLDYVSERGSTITRSWTWFTTSLCQTEVSVMFFSRVLTTVYRRHHENINRDRCDLGTTVCKTVRPMLYRTVVLSCLSISLCL